VAISLPPDKWKCTIWVLGRKKPFSIWLAKALKGTEAAYCLAFSPHHTPSHPMTSHHTLSHPMTLHDTPWHPMTPHGTPWHPMSPFTFYLLPFTFFLSYGVHPNSFFKFWTIHLLDNNNDNEIAFYCHHYHPESVLLKTLKKIFGCRGKEKHPYTKKNKFLAKIPFIRFITINEQGDHLIPRREGIAT
jgi:hypothetical protein